jgi:hypothetical protein
MAAADAALYGAKHNGRDQVVVASLKGAEEAAMQEAAKSAAGWK